MEIQKNSILGSTGNLLEIVEVVGLVKFRFGKNFKVPLK